MTNQALIQKAVKFLTNPEVKGTVQLKLEFLRQKGLNETEILEALNQASGGELLESALGIL